MMIIIIMLFPTPVKPLHSHVASTLMERLDIRVDVLFITKATIGLLRFRASDLNPNNNNQHL